MKLHEFLKQFEGLDPELEVGIGDSCYFIDDIKIGKVKVEPSYFNNKSKIFTMKNKGEDVIVISR